MAPTCANGCGRPAIFQRSGEAGLCWQCLATQRNGSAAAIRERLMREMAPPVWERPGDGEADGER